MNVKHLHQPVNESEVMLLVLEKMDALIKQNKILLEKVNNLEIETQLIKTVTEYTKRKWFDEPTPAEIETHSKSKKQIEKEQVELDLRNHFYGIKPKTRKK